MTRFRRGRGEVGLAPIGVAIGGMLALALAIAGGTFWVVAANLHFLPFRREPLTAATLYDLLKVAFAFAAGVGGVVALVTAYRRQRVAEFAQELAARAEEREAARLFNERFATAAGQLGQDAPPVRLAGVYAMAGLADDWPQQRQTCVDVLCAYLRMPYEPEPAEDAPAAERQAFLAVREIRHTVIRVITAHLQPEFRRASSLQDWRGLDFDFTGAIFDGGDFSRAEFTGGMVSFKRAEFASGMVSFFWVKFASGTVSFDGAKFNGGRVSFFWAMFTGGMVSFDKAKFTGGRVSFTRTRFTGGMVSFDEATFTGGRVSFTGTRFTDDGVVFGGVRFDKAEFTGGTVDFRDVDWTGRLRLPSWSTAPPGVVLPEGWNEKDGGSR